MEVKSDDIELMKEYGQAWQSNTQLIKFKTIIFVSEIQSMGEMEPEFDNETLNLTGKTLRFIMKKTANFGVNNYIRFDNDYYVFTILFI